MNDESRNFSSHVSHPCPALTVHHYLLMWWVEVVQSIFESVSFVVSLSCSLSSKSIHTMSYGLPRLEYYLINAFETGKPGSGNQASVVIFPSSSDPRAEDDGFLLRQAQDFGFAETAFLVPLRPEEGRWGLRWFTTEVVSP